MSNYKWGCELYSCHDEFAKDVPGTLKIVAGMGYDGVEFFGDFKGLGYDAKELRGMVDGLGLVCCGFHTPWDAVQPDRAAETIEYYKTLGVPFAIVPWMPETMLDTPEHCAETAKKLNELKKPFVDAGIRMGYHNHASEVKFFDGSKECPLTALFDNTEPDFVLQLDVGHAINGRGIGLPTLLRRYAGRFKTVHVSPYSLAEGAINAGDGYKTMIGIDDVPWEFFIHECARSSGTEWFTVEYECSAMYSEYDGIDECMKAIRKLEKEGRI